MDSTPFPGRRRAVRRVALARLLSLAGTDASAVAASFALYAQTGSALWLSACMLVNFGLGSVLGAAGGRVADRFDRRRLMVAAELAGAACFVTLALVHTPPALLGVSVVATLAGLVFGPAANAAVPAIAGPEHLAWANGLIATGGNVGKMAGRVGAGALVAVLGPQAVFCLDAATFLASAALILSVRVPFSEREQPRDAGAGEPGAWRLVLGHPVMRPVVLSSCMATLMTSFSMTAETVLVFDFGAGALGLGLLTGGWGLGMVGGSWYAGRALHPANEPTAVFLGRVGMGVALAVVGLSPWFWPAVVCYVAGGAAGGFLLVAAQSLLQRNAPDALRGSVFGAAEGLKSGAFGIGVLAAGFVVEAAGAQTTYVLVGLGVLAGTVPLAALVRRTGGVRPLRLRPAVAPAG